MGFWDIAKRAGLGVATGGMSELGGARPLVDAAAGNDYTKNLLFGGNATKSIDAQPKQYDYATGQLQQMANNAQGRSAPTTQAAQLGPAYQMQGQQLAQGQMDQSRGGMLGVANRLGAIASGQQMGAGEMAVNRQLGSANAGMLGAARGVRGAQSAIAFRNAMRGVADNSLAGAGMAAQSRMQDQAGANAQLGSIYGGMYGQDANVAAQNAQLGQQAGMFNAQQGQQVALQQGAFNQQTNLANQTAQLQQQQMNDAQQIAALGQMLGWDQTRINAEIQKAQVAAGDKGILPGLLQAGGQIGAAYATGGASLAAGAGGGAAPAAAVPSVGPVTSTNYNDPLAPYRRPVF